MKFSIGSKTDVAHCIALKHEFLRCEDAFKDFEKFGIAMIMSAQAEKDSGVPLTADRSRWTAFKTYNAYARFIHHLYEFMLGALVRERWDTAQIRAEEADPWMQANAQRVLNGRRQSIINGTAPSWENDISYFPEKVPDGFAFEFRSIRNKLSGHVTYQRANINLSRFYNEYHKFVHMKYYNCLGHWGGHRNDIFPDLQEITDFSLLIREEATSENNSQQRSAAIMEDIWRLT